MLRRSQPITFALLTRIVSASCGYNLFLPFSFFPSSNLLLLLCSLPFLFMFLTISNSLTAINGSYFSLAHSAGFGHIYIQNTSDDSPITPCHKLTMTNTYIHTTAFFCSQRLSALVFKHTWGVNPQSLRPFTARFVFNLYIHFSHSVTIQRNLSTYSRRWTLHHLQSKFY